MGERQDPQAQRAYPLRKARFLPARQLLADWRSRIRALTNDEAALFRPGAQGSGDDIDKLQ